jgi:NhaP-type Na+/H+ or K+/H+ antiporter
METVYDWVTVGIFAGLIVLFLQRSTDEEARDSLWQYLVASVGCALANYLGNEGYHVLAVLAIAATLAYTFIILRPLDNFRQPRP